MINVPVWLPNAEDLLRSYKQLRETYLLGPSQFDKYIGQKYVYNDRNLGEVAYSTVQVLCQCHFKVFCFHSPLVIDISVQEQLILIRK